MNAWHSGKEWAGAMRGRGHRFVWDVDWNLLRTFMVIVQEKGITSAGEKLRNVAVEGELTSFRT